MNKLWIIVIASFLGAAWGLSPWHPARAGEWQEKPVMCAEEDEIFTMLAEKEEMLIYDGKLLSKVRDPDEADGLALNPAILPLGLYANLSTGTFTVLEYHGHPYKQFCIIAFGVEFKAIGESL